MYVRTSASPKTWTSPCWIPGVRIAELRTMVEELFPWLAREANITLATQRVEEHSSGNPTIYLNYVGPLQAALMSRS